MITSAARPFTVVTLVAVTVPAVMLVVLASVAFERHRAAIHHRICLDGVQVHLDVSIMSARSGRRCCALLNLRSLCCRVGQRRQASSHAMDRSTHMLRAGAAWVSMLNPVSSTALSPSLRPSR